MIKNLIYIIIFFNVNFALAQQDWHSNSKKAIKFLKKGISEMHLLNYPEAIEDINKAINADVKFVEAYLTLGQIYETLGQFSKAADLYKQGHDLHEGLFTLTLMSLGRAYFMAGDYKNAKVAFEDYLKQNGITAKSRRKVDKFLLNCNFSIKAMENPSPFNPVSLGDSINTKYHEYWPSLSADEEIMVFTSRIPMNEDFQQSMGKWQEDFFISKKNEGNWLKAKNMGEPINTPDNEGAQSLSVDGRIIFFTACNRDDGKGKCDIYFTLFDGYGWSPPMNLGSPINTANNEKQPSISPDGETLFFVSDRPDGKGKQDIWKSKLIRQGIWGKPINLGDSINTIEDEIAPFMHPDNRTLYFTSNGHIGMGGNDLLMSKLNDNGEWGSVINLGYPINSPGDEMGMVVNVNGDRAYYSSDRINGNGLDIFSFIMPEPYRPKQVSYMKGIIFDAETKEKLRARFQIIDIISGDTVSSAYSESKSGEFLLTIPTDKDYALNASRKGYLFYSDNFSFSGEHTSHEPYIKDIPLQPIRMNKSIVLKNIFYESDSYLLKDVSKVELDRIYEFLILNPGVKIEIAGHTDDSGTEEYNLQLSQKRAEEVMNYLLKKDIDGKRIEAKGYGESLPVGENDTEAGKAQNRRTELKIIGN